MAKYVLNLIIYSQPQRVHAVMIFVPEVEKSCSNKSVFLHFYFYGLYLKCSFSVAVTCSLKVITFHEPLKPFIAITVEVTFLVAAILLYEKIWSKKNSAAGSWTANDVLYVNMLWDILSFDLNYLPYIQERGQMTNLTQCEYYREGFLHLSLAFAVFHDVHFCALIRTLGENCGSEGGSSMRQRKV